MKTLLLSVVASFLLATSSPPSVSTAYVCNGPASTRYHLKENCSGLNRCSTSIEKTTVAAAKEKGRTLCKLED